MWILKAILIVVLLIAVSTFAKSELAKSTLNSSFDVVVRLLHGVMGCVIGAGAGGILLVFLWFLLRLLIQVAGAPENILVSMGESFKNVFLIGGVIGGVGFGIQCFIDPDSTGDLIADNPGGCLVWLLAGIVIIYILIQMFR